MDPYLGPRGDYLGIEKCHFIPEFTTDQNQILDNFGKTQSINKDGGFVAISANVDNKTREVKGMSYLALLEASKIKEKKGNYNKAFQLQFLAEKLMAEFYHCALKGKPQKMTDGGLEHILQSPESLYYYIGVIAKLS